MLALKGPHSYSPFCFKSKTQNSPIKTFNIKISVRARTRINSLTAITFVKPLIMLIKDFQLSNAVYIFIPHFISHCGSASLVIYPSFMHLFSPNTHSVLAYLLPLDTSFMDSNLNFFYSLHTFCFNELIYSYSNPS